MPTRFSVSRVAMQATMQRAEARNEFKLATPWTSPAGTILSFGSRRQQPATTAFLLQIDPGRKANFMLRSRRASASLLAHYVFQPTPPSHIIARLSLLFSFFLNIFFSFFFHSQLLLVRLSPLHQVFVLFFFSFFFSFFFFGG